MAGSEIKVLVRIVDDDSDLRAAIRFLLESEGWEVADYYSAADFLLNDDPKIPGLRNIESVGSILINRGQRVNEK